MRIYLYRPIDLNEDAVTIYDIANRGSWDKGGGGHWNSGSFCNFSGNLNLFLKIKCKSISIMHHQKKKIKLLFEDKEMRLHTGVNYTVLWKETSTFHSSSVKNVYSGQRNSTRR